MSTLFIRGGTVVNADCQTRADVLCVDGKITAMGEGLEAPAGATVVDAGGPGFGPSGVTGVPVGPWLPAWLTLGVVGMAAWLRRRSAA